MNNIVLTNNKDLRLVGMRVGVLSTLRIELPLIDAAATNVEVIITNATTHTGYLATYSAATHCWVCDIAAAQFPVTGKQSYEVAYLLGGKQFWDGKGWIEVTEATTSGISPTPVPPPTRYVCVSVNGYTAQSVEGNIRIPKLFLTSGEPGGTDGYIEGDEIIDTETGYRWVLASITNALTWVQVAVNLSGYYTKAQTDAAINALAAYYITANAQGAAFATYAALANAETFYSGGEVRIPTRNDYAVVLEDETHGGAEYRYIYAVPTEGGAGHWEPQYPIETNEYTALQHKPQIGGVELVGNKTLAQLGIASAADATLTALTGFSGWTIYREGVDVTAQVSDQPRYVRIGEDIYAWLIETVHIATDQVDQDLIGGPENATSLSWRARDGEFNAVSYTAVRKALSGYRLGPADGPNADKPVASEAEAESLREKKYEKPSGGIPKSDLASTVQASLGKADTAVQPEQGKGLFSGSYTDLTNKPPLGTAAAKDVPASGNASSSQVVLGNDTRLGDARTPTAHKSTHASGGTDPLSPSDIGAAPASDLPYSFHAATVGSGATPTVTDVANRAINYATLGSTVTAATVTLPAAVPGHSRDFFINLTIEASTAPTLVFNDPATSTTATIAFGADSLAGISAGENLIRFQEIQENKFLVEVWTNRALSAIDYEQSGLIHMWDGRENDGWNKHAQANPKDLIGSADLSSSGSVVISSDAYKASDGGYFFADIPSFASAIASKNFTIELVVKNIRATLSPICGIGNRGLWLYGGSTNYNVDTLNILTTSYGHTPQIKFSSDEVYCISITGGTTPTIIINGTAIQAIYGEMNNVSPTTLYLGALSTSYTVGECEFYNVRLYSRSLTNDEIAANHAIDKERFGLT